VRSCVVLVAIAGCGKAADNPAPRPPPPAASAQAPISAGDLTCEPQPFATTTPVPEASGAGWITFRGKPALFVLSDSGNEGAYGIVDPDTGDTVAMGRLPKGDHGDDYEGVTTRAGKLYAVISNGWYVRIDQDGEKFTTTAPRALGERSDLADKNFEGICLDERSESAVGPCAGFVASKGDGHLYCLLERDGALTADFTRSIEVTKHKRLADCAIDERGTLWAGSNIHELNRLYRIDDWRDPAHATIHDLGPLGVGNSEVVAVRGEMIYRMSDLDTAPSMMAKFRCTPAAR
jgi:hypothetical protein